MKCVKNKSIGLLILRLFLGGTFVFHGILKFKDMAGTKEFFTQIGFSSALAPLVATIEVLAGLAMIFGAFTLYAGILLAIIMAVAAFKLKWGIPNVPFMQKYLLSEIDLSLLASAVAIIFTGPGKYSVMKYCKCHGKGEGECGVCKIGGCEGACSDHGHDSN